MAEMGAGGLASYYAARAAEYEAIYRRPERQADLARLRDLVRAFAKDRRILEVACGTGYWTSVMAESATSVLATDLTDPVLAVARSKQLPATVVRFERADAHALHRVEGAFDAGFAGFFWSHLPKADLGRFVGGLCRRLQTPARVLIVDNRYVQGSSTDIARADAEGNTYQQRVLANGAVYEVLKNFPRPDEVRRSLEFAGAEAAAVTELEYYWYATWTVIR